MRTRLASLPALAGALLLSASLVGCSSSKSVGSEAAASTSSVPASTSSVPASTSVPETTTPATSAPAPTAPSGGSSCTDRSPSGSAVQVTVVNGDWNGDGTADSALSWGEPTGGGANWFVRMQVAGGSNSAIALGDLGPSFAAVVGRADVDFSLGAPAGSNEDELVAIVGSNAAGYNLGVFGIGSDGCAFQFDDGAAGSPYIIPVHAAVATTSGLRCDGGMGSRFMVRLEANSADGVNYTTNDIRIERTDGNSLADGVSIPGTITSADAGFMAYQQAECDGVLFVGGGADF